MSKKPIPTPKVEPSRNHQRIVEALEFVRINIPHTILDDKQKIEVLDFTKAIELALQHPEDPKSAPLGYIYNQMFVDPSVEDVVTALMGRPDGWVRNHYPTRLMDSLRSASTYVPPGPKPPATFYLPIGSPQKTDQYGESFKTSQSSAARKWRLDKSRIEDHKEKIAKAKRKPTPRELADLKEKALADLDERRRMAHKLQDEQKEEIELRHKAEVEKRKELRDHDEKELAARKMEKKVGP